MVDSLFHIASRKVRWELLPKYICQTLYNAAETAHRSKFHYVLKELQEQQKQIIFIPLSTWFEIGPNDTFWLPDEFLPKELLRAYFRDIQVQEPRYTIEFRPFDELQGP